MEATYKRFDLVKDVVSLEKHELMKQPGNLLISLESLPSRPVSSIWSQNILIALVLI